MLTVICKKITILQTMSKKYSEIKTKLKIEITKTENNDLAHLTHYLQNHKNGVSQCLKPMATSYRVRGECPTRQLAKAKNRIISS